MAYPLEMIYILESPRWSNVQGKVGFRASQPGSLDVASIMHVLTSDWFSSSFSFDLHFWIQIFCGDLLQKSHVWKISEKHWKC